MDKQDDLNNWVPLIDPAEVPPANGPLPAAPPVNGGYVPARPELPVLPAAQAGDQSARLARRASIRRALLIMALLLGLLWAVEGVDALTPSVTSDVYGIHPRTVDGLRNIAFAPFLHANFAHLSANSVPLIVLGLLVLLSGVQPFLVVSLVAALVSGFGVWLFGGGDTVHLGASGVIFGYLGFLLAAAWFQRSAAAIVIAILAAFLYGGMLWGVLPGQEGVSWLGHLFGLLGGIAAAYFLRAERKPAKV